MIAIHLTRRAKSLAAAAVFSISSPIVLAAMDTPVPDGQVASATVASALSEALVDEYRARDTYRAILRKYGSIRPFSRIVEAEQRHIDALLKQFARLDLEAPKPAPITTELPPSVREACRIAAAAEIGNAEMYDRLIVQAGSDTKVLETFERLRAASLDRHLPAFERCVERRGHGN